MTLRKPLGSSAGVLALATLAPALAVGLATTVATAPAAQAAPAAAAPSGGCTTTQQVTTCTFRYTNGPEFWTVPAGVDRATFTVVGASGGDAGGRPGGRGGGVSATLDVAPGTLYQLVVGGKGTSDTDAPGTRGGYNGGGHGGGAGDPGGAGGGGASDIRTTPFLPSARILVGGGGGGAGSPVTYANTAHGIPGAGGAGGTLGDGGQGGVVSGAWVGAGGGGGGTANSAGAGGGPSGGGWSLFNGCGVWSSAHPVQGTAGYGTTGGAGGYLRSGNDTHCDEFRGWGGGGGGGWYGGGGGGGGITAGGGGGGGSGYGPAGSTASVGQQGAHGVVTITYSAWNTAPGSSTMTSAPTAAGRPPAPDQPDVHDVFYLNDKGNVIQRTVSNGVAGPERNHGAVLYPGSTVAAVWRPDGSRLDLFGRGTESALWQKTFTWTGGWDAWHPVAGAATMTSDPSAASTSPDRVVIFYRGKDASMLERVWLVDGEPPSRTGLRVSVDMATGPAAAAHPNGDIRLYFGYQDYIMGPAAEQLTWRAEDNNWIANAWRQAAMESTPTYTSDDGQDVVAYRSDGAIIWVTTPVDGWSVSSRQYPSPPSPSASALALARRAAGGHYVYARGNDNLLTVRAFTGD